MYRHMVPMTTFALVTATLFSSTTFAQVSPSDSDGQAVHMLGRRLGQVLGVEVLGPLADPLGPPLQRGGSAGDLGEHDSRHRRVVVDDVLLRDPREHLPLGAADAHADPVQVDEDGGTVVSCHPRTLPSGACRPQPSCSGSSPSCSSRSRSPATWASAIAPSARWAARVDPT